TGDPKLDYLSDGITESLINQLSELPNLRVTARPTVFQFKGKEANPLELGKELAVGVIATGKVAARGETLQVQADLIDTRSGTQIWGGSFDAARKERASLPARLARQIAKELEVTLTRAQTSRFSAEADTDPAAFDLFLQGRDALNTDTAAGRFRAIGLLENAVEADPDFARAHAALAEAYVRYSTTADPLLMFRKARESVARALAADPNLAEAHLSRGIILFWSDWDFAGAEQEYRRALTLSPSLASASAYYAELLQCAGDFEEGIRQARRARELDPLSRGSAIALAAAYIYAGRYGEARAELTRLLRGDPDYPSGHVLMGRVLHLTGDLRGACREYTLADELSNTPADQVKARRAACEADGVAGYNREQIRVLEADPASDPYLIGGLYAELGDTEKAIEYLELAYRQRATGMLLIKSDPAFAAIRSDPRFVDLMKRVGFPQVEARAGAGG
ncbi:MAG TPA: tetratricopeptide repeat protein, partial [Thermoanaerobaculia bacterium]